MHITERKTEILKILDGLKDRLFSLSCAFYHNPETGLKEFKTSAACISILGEFGFKVDKGVAGMETAFKAAFGSGRPAISLLVEMDALPQIGHGCGHNISGIASIGAAYGFRGRQELEEAGADVIIEDIRELTSLCI